MFFHKNRVLRSYYSNVRRNITHKITLLSNIGTILIKNELLFLFKSVNKIIILHFKNSN